MGHVLLFLLFTGGGLLVCRLSKRDFGVALPVFMQGTIAVLYLCGLAGILPAGLWAVALAAAAGLLLLGAEVLRKKSLRAVWQRLGIPSFFAFAVLFVFVLVVNRNRNMVWGDEFSFWGLSVKEMVRLDALYNVPQSAVASHRDYPPAIMLFEYLWCKLCGAYSEPSLYRGLQFLTLGSLLPAFSAIGAKKWQNTLGLLVMAVFLHTVSGANLYASSYIDATMGVLVGYAFSMIITESRLSGFGLFSTGLAFFTAVLAKQMGVFALVPAAVFLLALYVFRLRENRRLASPQKPPALAKTPLALLAAALGGAVLASASWSIFKASVGVARSTFGLGGITPLSVLRVLAGGGDETQATIIQNFLSSIIGDAMYHAPLASATYFQAAVLGTALAAFVLWRYRHTQRRGPLFALAVTVPTSMAIYALAMLMLYLFSFSAVEGIGLASYGRYMGTGFITVTTAMLLAYARFFTGGDGDDFAEQENISDSAKPGKPFPWAGIAAVTLVFFVTGSIYLYLIPYRRPDGNFAHMEVTAQQLQEAVDSQEEKVFVILQGRPAAEETALRYYAAPLRFGAATVVAEARGEGEAVAGVEVIAPQALADKWLTEGYGYVYIASANENLVMDYGELFAKPEDIQNDGLYRITPAQGGVILELAAVLESHRPE